MRTPRLSLLPGLYEITCRITGEAMLGRPDAALNAVVRGTLAQTMIACHLELHAFVMMSTHYHMLVSIRGPDQLSCFMRDFNGLIARRINRLRGRSGAFWQGRFRAIPVVGGTDIQVARLRYVLAHGVKEGLVAAAGAWPGVSSARALAGVEELRGEWVDAAAFERAQRSREPAGAPATATGFTRSAVIRHEPLPCWRHLAPEDQRAQVQALLRAIDEEGAEEHQRAGTRPLGAAAIAASDPYARVARQPADAAPAVIARSKEVRDDWRARQQEQTARWIALATAIVQRLKALGLALWTGANWWTVGGALRRLARALARLEPAENCS